MTAEEARQIAAAALASGALQVLPKPDRRVGKRRPRTQDERDRISARVRASWTPEARKLHGQKLLAIYRSRREAKSPATEVAS